MRKTLFTLIVVAAHLVATLPAHAEETVTSVPQRTSGSPKAPHFISKGKPLTAEQIAALNQRASVGRISRDAAGKVDTGTVVVGIVIAAGLGALIYILVDEARDSWLF